MSNRKDKKTRITNVKNLVKAHAERLPNIDFQKEQNILKIRRRLRICDHVFVSVLLQEIERNLRSQND